jgi:plasmid stability protein
MATLYVENVPDELYKALRERARANRNSIAAEIIALLKQNVPTSAELRNRQRLLKDLEKVRGSQAASDKAFPPTDELQREDRAR